MRKVQIFDRAMCCSTGICGPQVDPTLPRFAADLDWLKSQGNTVERFSLSQNPSQFATNSTVQHLLETEGVECLPLVIIDDHVVSRSEYPSRENLALWTGTRIQQTLPTVAPDSGKCCGSSDCC